VAAGPDRAAGGAAHPAVLVSLGVLFLEGDEAPCLIPDAADLLARLDQVGRTVLLLERQLAGHRLPPAGGERLAWLRATLGAGPYAAVDFEAPSLAPTADEAERASAATRWAELAATHEARWLLSPDAGTLRPARSAGLAVILVGPRSSAEATVVRADYEARDLRDAVNHLLLDAAFEA
jgi:hypothetical protein